MAARFTKAAPAMPLFGDAYLADTRHLSLEEHGAYLQLLMIAWRSDGCCLPNNDARIGRMLGVSAAKWAKIKPAVMAFWTLSDGSWFQARLTKERTFVEEKSTKNRTSASARWHPQVPEKQEGEQCERISERNAPSPSPSPSPQKEEAKATPLRVTLPYQEALDDWSRAAGIKGWKPLNPSLDAKRRRLLGVILTTHGLEGWRGALARAASSDVLGGPDPPAWFNFAFMLRPDKFLNILEGNYDRSFTGAAKQQPSPWLDARADVSNTGIHGPARG